MGQQVVLSQKARSPIGGRAFVVNSMIDSGDKAVSFLNTSFSFCSGIIHNHFQSGFVSVRSFQVNRPVKL